MGGAVQHRLGLLDLARHVGQVVLDRLEAADRPAELLALGHVVHRQVEHALGQAEQLPRHRQRAAVEHLRLQAPALLAGGQQGLRRRVPADLAEAPRGIDTRVGLHIHRRTRHQVQVVARRQDQHLGQLGIADQRVDAVADRQAHAALGNARQQLGPRRVAGVEAGQQAGGHIGSVSQRVGDAVVAQLLGHQGPGHVVHAQPALGFGHRQCGQALGGDAVAQVRRAAGVGFPDFAEHLRGGLGHQETADGLAERQLVIGKGEVHGLVLTWAGRACARR